MKQKISLGNSKFPRSPRSILKMSAVACALAPAGVLAQVPPVDALGQSDFQANSHFLTFIGSFAPENVASAKAYYKAIDPTGSKVTFTKWLVNAGFIANESQWHSTGKQLIACNGPGCDLPAGTYGDNVVNTDSHVIVLNAADLGFVRNQFIRCVPSCTAKNPIIYTYLENYPVAPFAAGPGGSGFPAKTGFPTAAESKAAIQSAITRPIGTVNGQKIDRIADVAFEWAPPAAKPTSSTRFGQLYAYIFHRDSANNITETINWPDDQPFLDSVFNSRQANAFPPQFPPAETVLAGNPFAPELDGRGVKQMPGVCLVCHGGKPQNLTSTGAFPRGGKLDGFRFLPIDVSNMNFTSDNDAGDPLSRAAQEAQMKQYNKAVLLTVDQSTQGDGTGAKRQAHLAEVIKGWYASFVGDQTMSAPTQNVNFVPAGWTGHEKLYLQTVATSCRSCHFNREISLDFGTAANFGQESDMLQLALLPFCNANTPGYNIDPKLRPMPLASLTYQRYWQSHLDGNIANNFGFASTAGYCATNP
jgi:hypothetical protein